MFDVLRVTKKKPPPNGLGEIEKMEPGSQNGPTAAFTLAQACMMGAFFWEFIRPTSIIYNNKT